MQPAAADYPRARLDLGQSSLAAQQYSCRGRRAPALRLLRAAFLRRRRSQPRCVNPWLSQWRHERRKIEPWLFLCAPLPPLARAYFSVLQGPACLPQFQSRQREQRKYQRGDPKAHDHFRFAPTQQLKVMVNRRHAEDALPAQLERADLQNHGERFDNKNSAYKKEQDLLLDDHGDGSQSSAQSQRTDIAHKYFGG